MLIYNYILTILYIFLVEFIWIYLINKKNYSLITKNVQKTDLKLNIKYAIISYILVITSIFFITIPYTKSKIKKTDTYYQIIFKSFIYSGLIGFYIYSIYNFTSLSIYKDYTLFIAIIDTLWGTFLYTTSALLFIYLSNHMLNSN